MRAKERKPLPEGIPATDSEAERALIHNLSQDLSDDQYQEALWELASFYIEVQNPGLASPLIYQILEVTDSIDTKALCYFRLGGMAETRNQYDAAIDLYTRGTTFRTRDKDVKYWLHNNTAYCLNVQGNYRAAEGFCRLAIEIDPERHNAYKNLGLSLAGQNKIVEAARAYILATKAYPLDVRAFYLVQELVKNHAKLMAHYPMIGLEIEECRRFLDTILNNRESTPTYEICRLKYVPDKGFWELKNGVARAISSEEIARLYTEQAIYMTRQYPSRWCGILGKDIDGSKSTPPAQKSRINYKNLMPSLVLPRGEPKGAEKIE